MCGHPPPAAHTSLVGSRHQVKKSVHDLSEKATPGCPDIAVGIQTNIWHPTEARLEARGPAQREENGFLRGHSSVPGCCSAGRAGQSQAISTHATSPAPQSVRPRVYSNEARNCTYIGRSKVIVKAAAGKGCSPELWKLLSTFLSSLKLGFHLPPPPHP